jgi:3-phosphoshikimate 1-carboxyvinyltransferase
MKIYAPDDMHLEGCIQLPASKSIANRALIIQFIADATIEIENISVSEDTRILSEIIAHPEKIIDCGMAGTTLRFLTAAMAIKEGVHHITGSERMKQRPIGPLTDALQQLGSSIHFTENEGFPPFEIKGGNIEGGMVSLPANISSQFVSALMLIAPQLKKGMEIRLTTSATSRPYIEMTANIMRHFGAEVKCDNKGSIFIAPTPYKSGKLTIEGDWSAASYYYSLLALADSGQIELYPLSDVGWQGDSIVSDIYFRLGVSSIMTDKGILLEKSRHRIEYLEYDFSDCPDLAQTVICTCTGLGIEGQFTGMHTLKIKETDRIAALQAELKKLGWSLTEQNNSYTLSKTGYATDKIFINTYHDHRMAMSFAPLALTFDCIEIENPEVVKKSNPDFWQHLESLGLAIKKP